MRSLLRVALRYTRFVHVSPIFLISRAPFAALPHTRQVSRECSLLQFTEEVSYGRCPYRARSSGLRSTGSYYPSCGAVGSQEVWNLKMQKEAAEWAIAQGLNQFM
jgi:hypothetical protein